MGAWTRAVCLLAAAVTVPASAAFAGPPLRRDLGSYVIFGLRSVGLKNITVTGACNTGVDCAQPTSSSSCGVITHENPLYADGSQIAGDVARFSRGGGIIYQLFSNHPSGLENVFINEPPVESPVPLPILGDVDGDGTPSCSIQTGSCVVDAGDLEEACGFPTPFPACDASKQVVAMPNADCQGAADSAMGNGRCDLPAGTYGNLAVRDNAKLAFDGGTYTFCNFQFGRDTETVANTTTVVNVDHGDVGISNGSIFGPAPGTGCGLLTVNVKGPDGPDAGFSFGRNGSVNGFFCAPERTIRLGHNNNLSGHFFGDTINADSNDRAFCCKKECLEAPPPSGAALRRTLDAYFILANRHASLKNLQLGTPCNVGVNCGAQATLPSCGVLRTAGITMVDGSQLVGDQTFFSKPSRVWQSFRNNNSPLDNVQLAAPPPNPQPFDAPVIPGTCDAACTPDIAAMKALCGFPTPFPACDASKPVKARRGADCPPYDTVPGNQQCDLPPGTYGSLTVQNNARLNLQPGDYVVCRFRAGRRAKITADATTILVPEGGVFRSGNATELAEACGDLRILVDGRSSSVAFGRNGLVAAQICAPEARIRLGHNNVLIGQFVADTVNADLHNVGQCCQVCLDP
jgi:hypothetical protein